MSPSRTGRPRASSPETLAEAACELFLEQGYEFTSISDITQRAGVSRSSFFNYFASKSAIMWSGLDERIQACVQRLAADDDPDVRNGVQGAIVAIADGFTPDSLALAWRNADAMEMRDELEQGAALRQACLAHAIATRFRRSGATAIEAEVWASAWAATVLVAVRAWSEHGSALTDLTELLNQAIASIDTAAIGSTRRSGDTESAR